MRILVVDDHELVRRGICTVLAAEPSLLLCGEAVDGRDAVEKAKALCPDVVVMDISMPNMNGIEATREIKRLLPQTQIVMVSQHDAKEMVRQSFHAGASGYVVKSTISTDLLTAIAKISEHKSFVKTGDAEGGERNRDAQEILEQSASFEKTLRENEERFRLALNSMADGVFTIDRRGLVTYVNPAAEKMLGWSSGELLGKNVHEAVHYKRIDGALSPASECGLLDVVKKGVEIREREQALIRKDGSALAVVSSATPLRNEGETSGAVVCFRDDTRRLQKEEALQQSERIYRGIGESINYGVWVCDAAGRNVYASPSFLELLGLTQDEFSELGWRQFIDPGEATQALTAWKECVRAENFWERESRIRGADGKWHHVLTRGVPIRDSQGTVLGWAGVNLDIQYLKDTQGKLRSWVQTLETRIAERTRELEDATGKLRELSGKLLQTQDEERRRIARELHDGVGQLLAGLHMNLAKLGDEKNRLSPEAGHCLDENMNLIEQASQEIRTLSHLLHPPLLDEVGLESALRWYAEGFAERSHITVHLQLAADFGEALPRDLALSVFRIVQECLTNVHRHSESLTAAVKIERTPDEITLEVTDNGKGISEELRSTVFSGAGSGVGLRGMRERVRQFGGRLEISSDENGTRVIAVLPIPTNVEETDDAGGEAGKFAADESGKRESREDEQTIGTTGSAGAIGAESVGTANGNGNDVTGDAATILCIDDEVTGSFTRKLLLESAGHRVIEARSGAEGIRLFQSENVAAVILDYWMSGMKGTAVAAEMKRINPAVPIIVLSGMSDLPGEAAGLVDQWIVKGSTRAEQLLDSINTLLQRRPA